MILAVSYRAEMLEREMREQETRVSECVVLWVKATTWPTHIEVISTISSQFNFTHRRK